MASKNFLKPETAADNTCDTWQKPSTSWQLTQWPPPHQPPSWCRPPKESPRFLRAYFMYISAQGRSSCTGCLRNPTKARMAPWCRFCPIRWALFPHLGSPVAGPVPAWAPSGLCTGLKVTIMWSFGPWKLNAKPNLLLQPWQFSLASITL